MNPAERYFDNAATTPIDERALREMLPYFGDAFGNSESIHAFGQRAHDAVELARARVASLIGAEAPEQIVFTSGATESCNWVVRRFASGYISPWEHSAVREPALEQGYEILRNDGLTLVPRSDYTSDSLVCHMWVNNEIGSVWEPAPTVIDGVRRFSDATQALGKVPVSPGSLDFIACSAHKLYGPKGVGALYMSSPIEGGQLGGGQEFGLRAGTLNVPGIVGFGAACAIAEQEMEANRTLAWNLRQAVLERLAPLSDWRVNGGPNVSPYILSLSFEGIQGEAVVVDLDARGFAVSAGAACSSRSTEPSRVLASLGTNGAWLRGTVRVSFSRFNTCESAAELGANLLLSVQKLRTMR